MGISELSSKIYSHMRGFVAQDSTESNEYRKSIFFSDKFELWYGIESTLFKMGELKLRDDLFDLQHRLEGKPSETTQISSKFRKEIEGRLKSLESFCNDYNEIRGISSDIESGGYYDFSCECSLSYLGIDRRRIEPVSDRLNELERDFFIYTSLSKDRSNRQIAVEICQSRFLVPLREEIITKIEEMKKYSV